MGFGGEPHAGGRQPNKGRLEAAFYGLDFELGGGREAFADCGQPPRLFRNPLDQLQSVWVAKVQVKGLRAQA